MSKFPGFWEDCRNSTQVLVSEMGWPALILCWLSILFSLLPAVLLFDSTGSMIFFCFMMVVFTLIYLKEKIPLQLFSCVCLVVASVSFCFSVEGFRDSYSDSWKTILTREYGLAQNKHAQDEMFIIRLQFLCTKEMKKSAQVPDVSAHVAVLRYNNAQTWEDLQQNKPFSSDKAVAAALLIDQYNEGVAKEWTAAKAYIADSSYANNLEFQGLWKEYFELGVWKEISETVRYAVFHYERAWRFVKYYGLGLVVVIFLHVVFYMARRGKMGHRKKISGIFIGE